MSDFNEAHEWMTTLFDKPTERPRKALVVVGPEGSGKSIFARMLSNCLNDNQEAYTWKQYLNLGFRIENKRLVIVDELLDRSFEQLMPFIYENEIEVAKIGEPSRIIRNNACILILAKSFEPHPRTIILKPLEALGILSNV